MRERFRGKTVRYFSSGRLFIFTQSMGSVFKCHCDSVTLLGEMDDDGAMRRFSIPVVIDDTGEDTVYGLVSCEPNDLRNSAKQAVRSAPKELIKKSDSMKKL